MSDSWIGGDFAGLQRMGRSLTGAKEQLESVVKPLDSQVDSLVGAAGWQGDAAEKFRSRWISDSMTAGAYSELVGAVGQVLTDLGSRLESMNAALQNAADIAERKGVQLGPMGEPVPMMTGNPPSAAEQKALGNLSEYTTVYNEITRSAQSARLDAAQKLTQLYGEITGESEGIQKGDAMIVADYLRNLWTLDAEKLSRAGKKAQSELDAARTAEDAAKKALRAERKAYAKAGKALPKDFAPRDEYTAAMAKVDDLNKTIEMSENAGDRLPFDRELNIKLADALDGIKWAGKLPDFLKDVPVVDIGAAVYAGAVEAQDDHDKGWSWPHSTLVDVGGALVGVAVGAAVIAAAPEAVGAALGSVGEFAVGGAVAMGVGYFVDHAFHEHWSEDIHEHGVLGGLWKGTSDSVVETGKSIWGDVTGVGSTIASIF